jgi:hypothetical protein
MTPPDEAAAAASGKKGTKHHPHADAVCLGVKKNTVGQSHQAGEQTRFIRLTRALFREYRGFSV